MDSNSGDGCVRSLFHCFICVSLTTLVVVHIYSALWGPQESIDGSIGDVKYVVMQLTRGLSEINRKHERLQNEMEHISTVLPEVTAAAARAKEALDPSLRKNAYICTNERDFDRHMADYALESAGAMVVDTGDTVEHVIYESPIGWALHSLSAWMCRGCFGARAMIHPGSLPGQCWAFRGSRGEATIRLPGAVRINGFSFEHIPPHISPTKEISSAPRIVQIEGMEFRSDSYPHDFGSFEYNKEGKPIQYFEVLHASPKPYNYVKLRVLSNWGHPVYTCVYRFRVHGDMDTGPASNKYDDELQIDNEEVSKY